MADVKPSTPSSVPQKNPLSSQTMDRRSFFSWLTCAWLAFTVAVTVSGATMLRYLFPNVLFEPPTQFKIGPPDNYNMGEVFEGWKATYGIWVVRTAEIIYALSTICTHLGCTPNWLEGEKKFKCPCHGSGFRMSGINFEGPAPRPLERFRVFLGEDGQIVVDKSKKYQQEKGEWNDSESFIKV